MDVAPRVAPAPCPECSQGKHCNCDGNAWDVEFDRVAECPCRAAGHDEVFVG